MKQLLDLIQAEPLGVRTGILCRDLEKTPQELGDPIEQLRDGGLIFGFAGRWVAAGHLAAIEQSVLDALAAFHHSQPNAPWADVAAVGNVADLHWGEKEFQRLIQRLEDRGLVRLGQEGVRLAHARLKLTDRQARLLERTRQALESFGLQTPYPSQVAEAIHVPEPAIKEILRLGLLEGSVLEIAPGMFYTKPQLEAIRADAKVKMGDQWFEIAAFRDAFESSRKFVVPVLEFFDAEGWTERNADARRLRDV